MNICVNPVEQSKEFPWDNIFPDILWILFWSIILICARKQILELIKTLMNRLKNGASVKIGSFEIEGLKVTGNKINNHYLTFEDKDLQRSNERDSIYRRHRGVMPVHRIFKSQKDGQVFDILIYMIPHNGNNLIQVVSVEYSFGKMWEDKIFKASDRSNGFAIATSAYSPFLCSAKINFNDGLSETVFRYIDFEMGDVAETAKSE